MAVAIAAEYASTARACVDDARARVANAHVRDDLRARSLRIAHATASLNITRANARGGGGGVGARSLALACHCGDDYAQ